jgi:hypothetical protein
MPLTMQEKIETNSNNLKFNYYCENIDKKRKKITLDGIVYMFGEIVPNIKSCVVYYSKLTNGLKTFELKYPELYEFYKLLANKINFSEIEEIEVVHTAQFVKEVEKKMLNTLVRKSYALMAYFKSQGDGFKIPTVNEKDYFDYKDIRYTMATLKKHLRKIVKDENLIDKICVEMEDKDSKCFQEIIQKAEFKLNTPDIDSTVYQMQLLRNLAQTNDLKKVIKDSDESILIERILTRKEGPNLRKQVGAKFYDKQLNIFRKHYSLNT